MPEATPQPPTTLSQGALAQLPATLPEAAPLTALPAPVPPAAPPSLSAEALQLLQQALGVIPANMLVLSPELQQLLPSAQNKADTAQPALAGHPAVPQAAEDAAKAGTAQPALAGHPAVPQAASAYAAQVSTVGEAAVTVPGAGTASTGAQVTGAGEASATGAAQATSPVTPVVPEKESAPRPGALKSSSMQAKDVLPELNLPAGLTVDALLQALSKQRPAPAKVIQAPTQAAPMAASPAPAKAGPLQQTATQLVAPKPEGPPPARMNSSTHAGEWKHFERFCSANPGATQLREAWAIQAQPAKCLRRICLMFPKRT